ncbi:MAG: recombination regulator RecX [Chlorobium sp.]
MNRPSAISFALQLLSLRNHSREELDRKLRKKGYTTESIGPVLDKLTKEGVLNDRIFTIELIRSRSNRRPSGKLKMQSELRKRGVADTIIEDLLQEYESVALCHKAAEKKIVSIHGATASERKKKLGIFLHNRGFGWQEIQIVLKRFSEPGSSDDESCYESSP